MAYDEDLADRIRLKLNHLPGVEEKQMMGGLTFMLNGKMCLGIVKDEMMCRIDPALNEIVLEKTGCRLMDFTGKPMKGFYFVNQIGMLSEEDLDYWINLSVAYNANAMASKKKKK